MPYQDTIYVLRISWKSVVSSNFLNIFIVKEPNAATYNGLYYADIANPNGTS